MQENRPAEEDLAVERGSSPKMAAEPDEEHFKAADMQRKICELEDENAALLKMMGPPQDRCRTKLLRVSGRMKAV